jgi:hypothetical protein
MTGGEADIVQIVVLAAGPDALLEYLVAVFLKIRKKRLSDVRGFNRRFPY